MDPQDKKPFRAFYLAGPRGLEPRTMVLETIVLPIETIDPIQGITFIPLLCLGRGSNPHPVKDTILSRARIPIPPPRHYYFFKINLRRRPESNRRMEVLQTTAFPLRHYALTFFSSITQIIIIQNTQKF